MSKKLRIVHYLNQFFGQIGGEEQAGTEPLAKDGAVGPGLAFNTEFKGEAEIVGTVICGDTYFGENLDKAQKTVVELIKKFNPDVVIAGPAFNAGRYGVACGAVAQAVATQLEIPVVSGMYEENPGVEMYAKYAYIVTTGDSAATMRKSVAPMAKLVLKLGNGEAVGSPKEEGYHKRGIRKNYFVSERGSKRAVDMLVAKISGQPFETEFEMPVFDRVEPNPAVKDITKATIALVTSGGIVPKHNPDRIESSSASKFGTYSLQGVMDLTEATHETAHGGYDPVYANLDPDRVLPVDVLRDLEKEGKIGKLYEYWSATVGNGTSVASSKQFAAEIAVNLKKDGVDAVILTST